MSVLSALGGPALGMVGHLVTFGVSWLRDRDRVRMSDTAQESAALQASYRVTALSALLIHAVIAVALLVTYIVLALHNAPHDLVTSLHHWAGIGCGWLFGALTTRKP